MLVHVHFDAKYRVENAQALFGRPEDDEELISDRSESLAAKPTSAKYADLLKMHAYRDAIRRTAGAYVLYPGNSGDGKRLEEFSGFHEVLPGLGAFSIRPRADGTAEGLDALRAFLDGVIDHLSNRTTSRERATFHVAESYAVEEAPVPYGDLLLSERDEMNNGQRALPPAEHHVVVAWYDSPEQLAWTLKEGLAVVRFGDRAGTWTVPPEFASARHVLLRTYMPQDAKGLMKLKGDRPGYRVFTAADLLERGYPGKAGGEIYAVFDIREDETYVQQEWDGAKLLLALEAFESRRTYRATKLKRRSADPRVLSLRELLTAMK